ncbi:gametocyte-specific factor 1 homolog [Schistocerca gregaria]|uniref:gametocyte-specific factor 1 homolog n=1 Tax=Schistocerca gregaria TaxID=7010 RepID=UPI00211ECBD3|nr:gametocyte-specific factor 1 homolog [Schistocerca gregaria]
MQIHIAKCRKNHSMAEMQICPFNATHVVPVPYYQYHLKTCPSKKVIEQQFYRLTDEAHSGEIKAAPFDVPEIDCEENWDTQVGAGYDPSLKAGPAPNFVAKQGATKSEELAQHSDSRPSSSASTKTPTECCSRASVASDSTIRPREPKTRSLALQGVVSNRSRDISTSSAQQDISDELVASMRRLSLGRPLGRGSARIKRTA